jgi:hypothetical protein
VLVDVGRTWWQGWGVELKVGDKIFLVASLRGRQENVRDVFVGDITGVNLWNFVGTWSWLRGNHPIDNSSELKSICGEIHSFLSATPMVSELFG